MVPIQGLDYKDKPADASPVGKTNFRSGAGAAA
jgi:hypothetical protein